MASGLAQSPRSNFFYSFTFLPARQREAMHRIYDFCRHTDDLVDEADATESLEAKRDTLQEWRSEINAAYDGSPKHPIMNALRPTLEEYEIPRGHLLTLVDGVEMDLTKSRYETFDELLEYCYAVASVVGLMSIQVFGYKHESARDYAVNLGYALQLTNIIRDVAIDAGKGRIYLPQEDLRKFGVAEGDILRGEQSDRLIELMKFESSRAREYYSKARSVLHADDRARMFPAEIMDAVYYRLLTNIERSNFDVFTKRARVSTPHKLVIALKFWMNHHFASRS